MIQDHQVFSPLEEKEFVFIGGLHRSGTTLLARLLGEHPEVSELSGTGVPMDEGQFLQDVYPTGSQFGGPGRFGFEAGSYLDETSPLATRGNAMRLQKQWNAYWDLEKPYLLEKSPPNLIRTRFLQALFPSARFVIVTRHPIAVAYATRKWAKTSIRSLIEHWTVCHERFSEDRHHLRRCLVLKYETLVAEPDTTMERIWRFLGLVPHRVSQNIRKNVNQQYFSFWNRSSRIPLLARRNSKTCRLFGERVQQLGYTLSTRL